MDASAVGHSSLALDNTHKGASDVPQTQCSVQVEASNVHQQGTSPHKKTTRPRASMRHPSARYIKAMPIECLPSREEVYVPILKRETTPALKIDDDEDDNASTSDAAKSSNDTIEETFDFCDDKSDTRSFVSSSSGSASTRSDDDDHTASPQSAPHDDAPSHVRNAGVQYTTIHHVSCLGALSKCFTSAPIRELPAGHGHLGGDFQIINLPVYLATYPDLSFVVFYEYDCLHVPSKVRPGSDAVQRETIRPVSAFLKRTFLEVAKFDRYELHSIPPQTGPRPQAVISRSTVPLPESFGITYDAAFLYHHRKVLAEAEDPDGEVARLLKYIEEESSFAQGFRLADEQFACGVVSASTINYLFAPHDFLVSSVHGTEYTRISKPLRLACYVLAFQPLFKSPTQATKLACWRWSYTGHKLRRSDMMFEICMPKPYELVNITDLVAYPLKYACEGVREGLMRRGTFFWEKLRFQTHMAYEGWCWYQHRNFPKNTKVFVDYKIFNSTLPQSKYISPPCTLKEIDRDPYPDVIWNNVDDLGDLALLIPAEIVGFVMEKTSQWRRIQLDQICEIAWDNTALSRVILPHKTKDLASALVVSRMLRERNAPYEERFQGRCLTIHLHGPPGSGKTRLARALADQVQLPIYLKQAGTIATVVQDWRTFYRNVHLLQSSANFILLLDKVDGYLRKRGPCLDGSFEPHDAEFMNMFVRLLDQFPGIIILTSATIAAEDMDPHVRSQIKASFAFNPLEEVARRAVWTEKLAAAGCASETLEDEQKNILEGLSKKELNGWQINNTVDAASDFAAMDNRSIEWADIELALGMMDGEKHIEEL